MAFMLNGLLRCCSGNGKRLFLDRQRSLISTSSGSPRHQILSALNEEKIQTNENSDDGNEIINPLKNHDFFGVRNMFTLEDLFNARVHLGHKQGLRNPHMVPYIFGNRLGVDIIDLEQTVPMLQDALNFLAHIAFRQGVILFLSRHPQMMSLIESTARECGEYAHCRHWKGGTFTNMTVQFGAVTRLPDVCVFVSTHNTIFEQHIAVVEATKMNVPTIGVVDTSCDPRLISYPVPGNDDTPSAVELYCRLFKQSILKGKEKYEEIAKMKEQIMLTA